MSYPARAEGLVNMVNSWTGRLPIPDGWIYVLYSHLQHHNDTIIKRAKTSLTKYVLLTLLQGFEKVIQGLMVRGGWTPNINCYILTPLLWLSALCLSRSSALLNRRPWGPALCWMMVLYCILSTSSLGPNSLGDPGPLRPGVAFPTTSRL